ncbi:MAG: hypothetical protein NT001_07295 [Candidatus Woesearchaeota archaeon]|nr:hypothetical protein [Candidatus Woesearchaeota archaeon]
MKKWIIVALSLASLMGCKPNYLPGIKQDTTIFRGSCAERIVVYDNDPGSNQPLLKLIDEYCRDGGYGSLDRAYSVDRDGDRESDMIDFKMAKRWYDRINR